MGFLNIIPCFYFSLEAVLQGMPKINPTKKERNSDDIEAYSSV